jgi:hypothetical protein
MRISDNRFHTEGKDVPDELPLKFQQGNKFPHKISDAGDRVRE